MKKMQTRICLLLVLACALSAAARTVSSDEARTAARAWVNRGKDFTRMGVKFPSVVADAARAHTTTNGATFYSVKMTGGGTVFLAGDTEFEPVMGFTSETNDFTNIETNSPLWALLNHGVSRMKAAGTRPLKLTTSSVNLAASSGSTGKNAAKWAALIEEGSDLDKPRRLTTSAAAKHSESQLDDVRVSNLVKTKWSQSLAQGMACYNYYTPSSADPNAPTPGSTDNAVCGCVATAMSQIMRYFKYPTEPREQITEQCSYNGTAMELTTQGGTYDWDNMPLEPDVGTLTEAQCQAIGKLTSDAGISINMKYAPGGSGAVGALAGEKLKTAFGYMSAPCFWDENGATQEGSATRTEALGKLMFCNFDAGLPVYVTVPGHAIFADGYGYDANGVDYVHFNMGWAGSCDFWYNIPDLTEAGYDDFNELDAVVYNIFTDKDEEYAVMSGRILDDDGLPIEGAKVTVYDESGNWVASSTSNAKGIWSAIAKGGKKYEVEATDGHLMAQISVYLPAPSTAEFKYSVAGIGNSWGNDMVLAEPTVRVGENVYTTLDKALKAATNGNDLVEIVLPTAVKRPVTVLTNCTIFATNENAAASAVTCLNGAQITVADGVTVTMTNVVFDVAEKTKTVVVEDGGVLKIGGVCGLEAVETAVWSNLVVISELTQPFYVDCTNALSVGGVFARSAVPLDRVAGCANMMLHYADTRLGGEAFEDAGGVQFKWSRGVPVPIGKTVAQLDIGAGRVNYRALTDLFEDYAAAGDVDAEIVIRKPSPYEQYLAKKCSITIRGEGDARPVLTAAGTSGFLLEEGASLTVSNLVFSGYVDGDTKDDHGFIYVDGGELTLDDGAVLDSMVGIVSRGSGVIDIWSGTVTMRSGAAIVNCRAEGGTRYDEEGVHDSGGFGGAIYTACQTGGILNLEGGTITNCYASAYGGGVFVDEWYGDSAVINVSGDLTVKGNMSKDYPKDDVCLSSTRILTNFRLAEPLTGASVVGVWISTPVEEEAEQKIDVNGEGKPFITNAVGAVSAETLGCFFNDTTSGLVAAVGENSTLVWTKRPEDDGTCAKDEAKVFVENPDTGTLTLYYKDLNIALKYVGWDATFYLKDSIMLTNDVQISHRVTFEKYSGETKDKPIVWRTKHAMYNVVAGGSLTLSNVKLVGACWYTTDRGGYEPWDDDPEHLFDPLFYDDEDPSHPTEEPSKGYGLISVDGGSLTLADGARVGYVYGNTSRAANAITVFHGGTVMMESGSRVEKSRNVYLNSLEQTSGHGGGILLDGSTGHFTGGMIQKCMAYRGGGVFVANESTAYFSGDFICFDNHPLLAENTYENIVASSNSRIVLDGELTSYDEEWPDFGYIGVSEDIVSDTNWFATVEWDWPDIETLKHSASVFFHDKRGTDDYDIQGVPVTNGIGQAILAWEDCLSNAGKVVKDGEEYRIFLASGQTVVVPTAFSVATTTGADGKMVLSLNGGVEGCWYTVYSTTDLNVPFTVEKSVQLKAGEAFEIEVDQSSSSKFYKVVAEEGLK